MQYWLEGLGVFVVIVTLVGMLRARHERRRKSAEMRDYVRRNGRIGEQNWE